MTEEDPYRHHPELRGQITPAAESYFRELDLAELDTRIIAAGMPADWRTPSDQREAGRRAALEGHWDDDIWVFGYGSLMWDPAMEFTEIRRARSAGFTRNFCLWDTGARGNADQPGLMLAIDAGDSCEGLAFRIDRDRLDHETFVLFRREMIAEAYRPVWLTIDTDFGPIEALSFAANRDNERIVPDIPIEDQAGMIARASGVLGTNYYYLCEVQRHLALLDVEDPYVEDLYARVTSLRAEA